MHAFESKAFLLAREREPGDGWMRERDGLHTLEEKGSVCALSFLPMPGGSSLRAITASTYVGVSAVACGGGRPVVYEVQRRVKKHQGREGKHAGRAETSSFSLLAHVLHAT